MENGVNLREEILHLYKENYHGGVMKLVVIGGGLIFLKSMKQYPCQVFFHFFAMFCFNMNILWLCFLLAETLDILEDWVIELFGSIKKGSQREIVAKEIKPIWKAGMMYRLEAIKDVHVLDLTWTLPCLHKEYLKKPEGYISHLMGHGEQCHRLVRFQLHGVPLQLTVLSQFYDRH